MEAYKPLLFIVNAHAGRAQIRALLLDVLDIFMYHGYAPTVMVTQGRGDARDFARLKAMDYHLVVCSGGDGTLNETVQGLVQLKNPPPLGYIPAGTSNIMAINLKLPRDIKKAAEIAITGKPVKIDLGTLNGEYFSLVAGFGAFTDISYLTPQAIKNAVGNMAYFFEGIASLPGIRPYHARVVCDGRVIEDDFITGFITNVASIASSLGMGGRAPVNMGDGLFDVVLIKMPTSPAEVSLSISDLLQMTPYSERFYYVQCAHIEINCPEPLAWTLNGEFGGAHRRAVIENKKQALTIIGP